MTYTIVNVKQRSDEWHKLRKRITGSRIGKIVGHFRGDLTEEEKIKLGKIICGLEKEIFDEESKRRMNLGVINEDKTRRMFEKYISKKLNQDIKVNEIGFGIWNEDPRYGASPDGLFEYENEEGEIVKTGLEIKCPEIMYNVDIYDSHLDQILLCMKIFDLKEFWYCVNALNENKFRVSKIVWDEERWNDIYYKSSEFYNNYIKPNLK